MRISTDGSFLWKICVWNVLNLVNLQIQQSICISDIFSVFSAELLAILWAMWWIELVNPPPKSIICLEYVAAFLTLRDATSRACPDVLWEILCCLFWVESMGCPEGFLWIILALAGSGKRDF